MNEETESIQVDSEDILSSTEDIEEVNDSHWPE